MLFYLLYQKREYWAEKWLFLENKFIYYNRLAWSDPIYQAESE